MLSDEQLKLIIKALNDEFRIAEQKHENTLVEIQNLCPHTNLESVMMGKRCIVCGKYIVDERELIKYEKVK